MREKEVMNPMGIPVVDDPDLPLMGGDAGLMDPVPETVSVESLSGEFVDQGTSADAMVMGDGPVDEEDDPMDAPPPSNDVPLSFDAGGDDVGDGYLRLVLRLEDGELTVVGARVVEGPLVQIDPTGEMIYQASVGGRPVGVGGLPDLLEERGFAPEGDPTAGHAIGPSDGNEFIVRVPREDVTADELAELEVKLIRPAETSVRVEPGVDVELAAIEQGQAQPEVVATLEGVGLESIDQDVAEVVRARLR